ncbi:Protein kinase domain-containing protein [Cinnamomum micranthum f. kanehirae]|uniref:non-specific serine/threonine protein kinase n=1 Tax=Cinnamomum micranthum f. kanehirae TaxID=337451 RepID=A0A3S4P1L1_9MAGN|nr:Protein kinase domain-containing protein [Cinnamomum micranthum f. kanehirae]
MIFLKLCMIHRYSYVAPTASPPGPFSVRKEPSFPHKYLWGGLAVGLVIVLVGIMLYVCIRRRFFGIFKRPWRREVELLSRVKHRNLLGLVGFCEEVGQRILVYEYVPNGSLLEYITGRKGEALTWRQRVNIAIGAAKGIAHLHEGVKPSIIHRDIKPSNILVGDGFEAKVSDFGLVKSGPVGDASHVSSQIKGTPGYLDPAYCASLHLTPFSDVYSFGVILLQLVAAKPAVDKTRNNSQYHITEWVSSSLVVTV